MIAPLPIGQILVALRRIIRAIDPHKRRLMRDFGLIGFQPVVLRDKKGA